MHKQQQLNGFFETHPQETAVLLDYDNGTSHARSRNAKQFVTGTEGLKIALQLYSEKKTYFS